MPNFPNSPSQDDTYQLGNTIWIYNGTAWDVDTSNIATVGGGVTTTVSNTAPSSPTAGDIWLKEDTGVVYTYIDDGATQSWIQTTAAGGGISSIDIGGTSSSSFSNVQILDAVVQTGYLTTANITDDVGYATKNRSMLYSIIFS